MVAIRPPAMDGLGLDSVGFPSPAQRGARAASIGPEPAGPAPGRRPWSRAPWSPSRTAQGLPHALPLAAPVA